MTRRRCTQIERRAILEVHGYKCAYCADHLKFRDMEIEHIVPEHLNDNENARTMRFAELGLDDSFNLNGYENLVPACRRCNGAKSDLYLKIGFVSILLARAEGLAPRVAALIDTYKRQATDQKMMMSLLSSLESCTLSFEQVADTIKQAKVQPAKLKLSSPLAAFGETIFDTSPEEIDALFNREIAVNGVSGEFLRMVNDEGGEKRVNTLNQFLSAWREGYYAQSNAEMKISMGYFWTPIETLNLLRKAQIPTESYLNKPQISVNDIRYLPATLLMCIEDYCSDEAFSGERASRARLTVAELIDRGEAVLKDVASGLIRVEYDNHGTLIYELFRSDVNGDGLEELVVNWIGYPVDGTLRTGGIRVLTRRSQEGGFEEVQVDRIA